ncbi:MAG: hypothetical protein ABIM96_00410 [Candidatus Saccharimonas sp.]
MDEDTYPLFGSIRPAEEEHVFATMPIGKLLGEAISRGILLMPEDDAPGITTEELRRRMNEGESLQQIDDELQAQQRQEEENED